MSKLASRGRTYAAICYAQVFSCQSDHDLQIPYLLLLPRSLWRANALLAILVNLLRRFEVRLGLL